MKRTSLPLLRRRDFIAGLGSAAAWPAVVRAQQRERVRRVGVLMGWSESDPQWQLRFRAFVDELARLGWRSSVNLQIEQRWINADVTRVTSFAKELVDWRPDVIVSGGTPATAALQQVTRTVPIVGAVLADPIGSGFVASLSGPGANITAFLQMEGAMAGKWLQMIKEIAPYIQRAALMYNPETAPFARYYLGPFEAAAHALAVDPVIVAVRSDDEIESAIDSLGREQGGLIVLPENFMVTHGATVVAAASRNKVPSIDGGWRVGSLLSYGPNYLDMFRGVAGYVDRILKGEKPADLPVQLPTRYELVINLKTAKALGLTVPPTLLALADEVIE